MDQQREHPTAARSSGLEGAVVLLDCRRLGDEGTGRATRWLLRGLAELRPAGRWLLWGPPEARSFLWEGSSWRPSNAHPDALWGQRDFLRIPSNDVAIYMHQVRPLKPGPSVTLIHDTIPLRHGGGLPTRTMKRLFLRRVAHLSRRILTVSHYSRDCLVRDLGVSPGRIGIVRYPVDEEMAARVLALRHQRSPRDLAIYVGRFAAHKNLRLLVEAFGRTRFRARGGELMLVGGSPGEVRELRRSILAHGTGGISVEGTCSQAELEELLATARMLVLPSLEEGFGLPAWEAAACGLPLCVSDGGALPEIFGTRTIPFVARSVSSAAAAIDRAAETAPVGAPVLPAEIGAPTVMAFAAVFVREAEQALRRT